MEDPEERTGTLILRGWVEGDRPGRLRVRVLRTVGRHQALPQAVSDAADVHAAVQAWLDELLEPDG